MINDSINGKINIFGMTIDELRNVISDLGESRFRAVQLSEWLYKRGLQFFPDMNNMPKSFIEKLDKGWSKDVKYILTIHDEKYLLRLTDINEYEEKKKQYEYLKQIAKQKGFELTSTEDSVLNYVAEEVNLEAENL